MKEKIVCTECGNETTENSKWFAFDVHKGKKQVFFCSKECLSEWVSRKKTILIIVMIIGLVLTFIGFEEFGAGALLLFLVPYMLRHAGGKLAHLFGSGTFGEFLSFAILIVGCLTVVYPLVILIQEISEISRIKTVINEQ